MRRTTMIGLGLAAVSLLSLGACGKKAPDEAGRSKTARPPATSTRPAAAPARGHAEGPRPRGPVEPLPKAMTIRLVAPGSGAKRVLRYKIPAGTRQTFALEIRLSLKMTMAGHSIPKAVLPIMRFHLSAECRTVDAKGEMRMAFQLARVEVVERKGVIQPVLDQIQGRVGALKGLKGTFTLTPRGETRDLQMAAPGGLPAQLSQVLHSIDEQMRHMAVPLPAEPVGLGAKWVVTMPTTVQNVRSGQRITYALGKLAPESASLAVSVVQWAPPQPLAAPGLPAGMRARLLSLRGSGSGVTRVFFGKMVAPARTRMRLYLSAQMIRAGRASDMETSMSTEVEVKLE